MIDAASPVGTVIESNDNFGVILAQLPALAGPQKSKEARRSGYSLSGYFPQVIKPALHLRPRPNTSCS